jgi:hypothetical protein
VALSLLLAGCITAKKQPVKLDVPDPVPAPPELVVRRPAPRIIPPAPPPAPVKRACVPKAFPRAPKYPDTDAALRDAGGAADRYQLMAAGRVLKNMRLAELERIVEGCR